MNATFLVTLSTSDTDFLSLAQEIQDILENKGLEILQVHPWARPSSMPPQTAQLQPPKIQLPQK